MQDTIINWEEFKNVRDMVIHYARENHQDEGRKDLLDMFGKRGEVYRLMDNAIKTQRLIEAQDWPTTETEEIKTHLYAIITSAIFLIMMEENKLFIQKKVNTVYLGGVPK